MAAPKDRVPKNLLRYALLAIFGCCIALLMSCSTQSSEAFIDYHRSGGFTNLDDHLLIDPNGNATVTRKSDTCKFVLDDEINQLGNLFDAAMFSELDRLYLPENRGGDLTEYVITYERHTVKTMDSAVPNELWPLLESLNQIVEKCS